MVPGAGGGEAGLRRAGPGARRAGGRLGGRAGGSAGGRGGRVGGGGVVVCGGAGWAGRGRRAGGGAGARGEGALLVGGGGGRLRRRDGLADADVAGVPGHVEPARAVVRAPDVEPAALVV